MVILNKLVDVDDALLWKATAKSNGYNQRYRENRAINTRRGTWCMVRGTSYHQ